MQFLHQSIIASKEAPIYHTSYILAQCLEYSGNLLNDNRTGLFKYYPSFKAQFSFHFLHEYFPNDYSPPDVPFSEFSPLPDEASAILHYILRRSVVSMRLQVLPEHTLPFTLLVFPSTANLSSCRVNIQDLLVNYNISAEAREPPPLLVSHPLLRKFS